MESTGKYWVPIFNLLEDSIRVTIANPKWVQAIKGNKDDTKDSKWLGDKPPNIRISPTITSQSKTTPVNVNLKVSKVFSSLSFHLSKLLNEKTKPTNVTAYLPPDSQIIVSRQEANDLWISY
jgi:hypothetical protein